MATLTSGMVWEVRTDGNNLNGGGFNPTRASAGTDYSQQAAPQFSYTDLVITGVNTDLSSVARPFVAADVANVIRIDSGTGFNVGRFEILSVAGGVATMNASVGTVGSTAGVGRLGGALAHPGDDAPSGLTASDLRRGNTVFVRGGTYELGSTSYEFEDSGESIGHMVTVIGYGTVRGDGGMPYLRLTALNTDHGVIHSIFSDSDQFCFRNFIVDPNGDPLVPGVGVHLGAGDRADNIHCIGGTRGYDVYERTMLTNCSVSGALDVGFIFYGDSSFSFQTTVLAERCYAKHCAGYGFRVIGGGVTFLHCIAENSFRGFAEGPFGQFGNHYVHCVAYGNTLAGMYISRDFSFNLEDVLPFIQNCIFEGNGYGIVLSDEVAV